MRVKALVIGLKRYVILRALLFGQKVGSQWLNKGNKISVGLKGANEVLMSHQLLMLDL